ncbi:hypothetical protein RND81_09G212300 [Saponaria officinalis]|uniref:Calponin-homology (CH) domain-containing protein n=1 Tax=Saponaria officinalis TaxID=3572 RepID=A0AAW1IPQ4_SAPOF
MTVVSGGDFSPATVTSKSSVESNFRELDDAFLQTQTRIWLGEVLKIRLDEEMDISDILADGKLLSELSEVLSTMLPTLRVDATQSKTNEWKSFVSSKSTQRYMPYYNVGSFLKMCKNLGLDGIDLFTPSDVVEKRNTRKVCMCIRSLSKKARSKELNVPDFDSVTCTLTMPTNMVECIRKSLEMSQSNSSLSDGLEVDKVLSVRCKNRISNSASTVSNEYSSDICEDAESNFMLGEVNGPSCDNYDPESSSMQCSEVVDNYSSTPQINTRILEKEEDDQCEYLSPSNGESVGSPCSQYFSDQEVGMPSSDCLDSHVSGKVDLNSQAKPKFQNGDIFHIPIDWENGHLDFENHSDESNCVSHDKQDTDICDGRFGIPTYPSEVASEKSSRTNSIALGDVDVACEFLMEDGFDTSGTTMRSLEDSDMVGAIGGESLCDREAEEENICDQVVLQRASHVSGPIENPDFSCNSENLVPLLSTEVKNVAENPCDSLSNTNVNRDPVDLLDQMRVLQEQPSCPVDSCPNSCNSSSLPAVESNGTDDPLIFPGSDQEECSNHDLTDLAVGRPYAAQSGSLVGLELATDGKICSENSRETCVIPEDHIPLDDPQLVAGTSGSIEDADRKCLQFVEDIEKGKTEHLIPVDDANDIPQHKPQKKLLKSVIKGTAIVGVAVFLLHLRKNRQENLSRVRKQPVEPLKPSAPAPSSMKGQKGGKTSSVYPAEKLKFGF